MIRNKVIGVIFNGDFNGNENTDIELDWYAYGMINLWQLEHWKPVISGLWGTISVIIFLF